MSKFRLSLSLFLYTLLPVTAAAQQKGTWRISPRRINIRVGDDRPLQLLDANAQELFDANWSVDNPELADIESTEDGRAVLHAKSMGTVRVSAAWHGELKSEDINIWSVVKGPPVGATNWGVDDIGTQIRDLPAVPTATGPTLYSLEQNGSGETYLRAFSGSGMQLWRWRLPESSRNIELVCGDWTGGALISANNSRSFTLYTIGGDGKLRWRQTLAGIRKGHTYNLDHLVHILSQSANGTNTLITGFDELTGAKRFELPIPASNETLVNLHRVGSSYVCAAATSIQPVGTITTQLMVNMDGLAYVAFTENQWILQAPKCSPGAELKASEILFSRDEQVILWQIHPEGTVRSTVVEGLKAKQSLALAGITDSPTGAILTDNLNGVLLSIRQSRNRIAEAGTDPSDEFVYRINPAGEVLFKFPLPSYSGPLHDDMVIGENDIAFATRGGNLIAFSLHTGKEVWEWDSKTPEISVFAALANGACVVKTPSGMAEVNHGVKIKDMAMDGVPVLGWQGDFYQSHSGPSGPSEQ
ncbi:MAG: hypothetical protein JWN74_2208 [Acidobacteriaceae bacterium]|nr:hypothetical protein [Acidobacteriaceae bacterium]